MRLISLLKTGIAGTWMYAHPFNKLGPHVSKVEGARNQHPFFCFFPDDHAKISGGRIIFAQQAVFGIVWTIEMFPMFFLFQ
jgi:hypothetical protein